MLGLLLSLSHGHHVGCGLRKGSDALGTVVAPKHNTTNGILAEDLWPRSLTSHRLDVELMNLANTLSLTDLVLGVELS